MEFGICTTLENSRTAHAAGWDFVEESVQTFLQGQSPDTDWTGPRRRSAAVLVAPVANMLLPATLRVTGTDVNFDVLRDYMKRVLERARKMEIELLVFGSGGARRVPDGFDLDRARRQIVEFLRLSADLAGKTGVTLAIEPLNRNECNVINTVAEAARLARIVEHPNVSVLFDSYHFWMENESLQSLEETAKYIKHVHVADVHGRVAPGLSGTSDYVPLFRILKKVKYDRRISVESAGFDIAGNGSRVLQFLRTQWAAA